MQCCYEPSLAYHGIAASLKNAMPVHAGGLTELVVHCYLDRVVDVGFEGRPRCLTIDCDD